MVVRIPKQLDIPELKSSIGIGFFYLAIGKRPKFIITGEKKSVRIKMTKKAQEYFNQVVESSDFKGVKASVITASLSYIAENPILKK